MRGQPEGVQLCSISSCPGWDSEKRINMSWQQLMKSERGPQLRLLGRFWFSRSKCWQLRLPPTRSNLDGKEEASQMECPRRRNITYKETGEIWFMTVRVMRFLPGMSRYFSSSRTPSSWWLLLFFIRRGTKVLFFISLILLRVSLIFLFFSGFYHSYFLFL